MALSFFLATILLGAGTRIVKTYRSAQYSLVKCFNHFVQSVVNARRQRGENPNTSVTAETRKSLQTARMVTKLYIAVALHLQIIRLLKRLMRRSTIKCSRDWGKAMTNFTR